MSFSTQRACFYVDCELAARTPTASIGSHGDAQESFSRQRFGIGRFCGRCLFQLEPSQTASNLCEEVLQLLHRLSLILCDIVTAVVRGLEHRNDGMKAATQQRGIWQLPANAIQSQCKFGLHLWNELFSIAVLKENIWVKRSMQLADA